MAVILDGETTVNGVQVTAVTPGSSGNVPTGAVNQFATPPFTGATVINPLAFTTGRDSETDDQLRVRIKAANASTGLGTVQAVESACIGATAIDPTTGQNATIVSDNLVSVSYGAILYVDNGNGYEETSTGVGLESIVDSAIGGEQFFQLATGGQQAPVAKAFLQTNMAAPFDLIGGDTLAVIIGEVTYQHVFANSDFLSPGGATAYEVTASINADTTLGFQATTAGGGLYVVIRPIQEINSIQTTIPTTSGRNAAVLMGFSSNQVQTLRLYKNNIPLNEDGLEAILFTQAQELWSSSITTGDTLILSVDGTAPITYTVTDADFLATGLYSTVYYTNSLASWQEVFTAKLTGITTAITGNQLSIASNLGTSNRASVVIDPSSTLVSKGMFSIIEGLSSKGAASDFTLDRNTAQFELVVPLVTGDKLSAGSVNTQAQIRSAIIPGGAVTLTSEGYFWLLVDNPGIIISTGVVSNTVVVVSKPSANIIRYATPSNPNSFLNVQVGDYVIVWSAEMNAANRTEGRVHAIGTNTLDIELTASEYAAVVPQTVVFLNGFVVLRSSLAPQRFSIPSGTSTLAQIALELEAQTDEVTFTVFQEEYLIAQSNTTDPHGFLLFVTADGQGQELLWPLGLQAISETSLAAYRDSSTKDGQFPLFVHSTFITPESYANPPDTFVASVSPSINFIGRDPNELIAMLQPYGGINDEQAAGEYDQVLSIVSSSTVDVNPQSIIHRVRNLDRFYIANPLDFGNADTLVVVLDNNPTTETFEIPFYRTAAAYTLSGATSFNAYDVIAGPTASFHSSFVNFSFANFKVLMQAKKVLNTQAASSAILYRAIQWGRTGQFIQVSYVYPTVPNAPISSTVIVGPNLSIQINLQSGATVPSSIDNTTEWNVVITSNTPVAGVDQVTYSWNSVGTAPALTLSGGEYVNITSQTGFSPANTGIFRVSTQAGFLPTSTQFTVQRPTGVAVTESNIPTNTIGAITFYEPTPTTAAQIVAYVNANLKDITAVATNGGTGVIEYSTYEDTNFSSQYAQLQDGINWIQSSNISGSPQFTLKVPLTLPADVGYAFNGPAYGPATGGEQLSLVPTTQPQVAAFISILAVSGFTTMGYVNLVERASRLELESLTIGSAGSVQVIGGYANGYGVPILNSASNLNDSLMVASVNSIAGAGVHSDQWFRLQAAIAQAKDTLFGSNTTIQVQDNTPMTGQSTIVLGGTLLTQRYFGKPRNYIRTVGDTFRVENQGSLVCLSWTGVGTSPDFVSALSFNDSGGGTLNVAPVLNSDDVQYIILTGNANFTELSIGDLLTVSGMSNPSNNGTFLVTGVSENGKIVQVSNQKAVSQYSSGTFTFTGNSTAGDAFTIGATTLVAGTDFPIGGTQQITAMNLAARIGLIAGVMASVSGSVVTVTATTPAASIAISYSGTAVVTVSGSFLVGSTFVSGQFTATSQVSEGDTMIISSPFNVLNQGQFRIIRLYVDPISNSQSVWFENPDAIEEEVSLSTNPISFAFDVTTQFSITTPNNGIHLEWSGTGTEPMLGNAQVGDIVTLGAPFNAANQGSWMVIDSSVKLQEITQFTMPAGSAFIPTGPGQYFFLNSAGNVTLYYVWANVNGTNTDPAIGGHTGIQAAILSGDTSTQVATKYATAINGFSADFTASSVGNLVTVITTGYIETTTASNVNVPSPFSIILLQAGTRTYLDAINPFAVADSQTNVTLSDHRPQMQFYEYEATVPNDLLVITSNLLGSANQGSYTILKVLNQNTIVVNGSLSSVFNASLAGNISAVAVNEGVPYYGYKHVLYVASEPGAPSNFDLVFDTYAQYEKIDQSAGVEMTSLGKEEFNTALENGLDSYRFNTGLVQEANRIIYGDPRDPQTYPGVGAAGADIFVQGPLTLRIQVSIDVRLKTGVAFSQMVTQVRSAVASLINANDVGQSIPISAIVSVVQAIPGVISVAISSPTYDATNDLIPLQGSQKALIVDPTTDVLVNQIGT